MNELYEAIEKKIKASGYPRTISGADVYDDICDQIEGKENGEYILLSKFDEDVVFEMCIRDRVYICSQYIYQSNRKRLAHRFVS